MSLSPTLILAVAAGGAVGAVARYLTGAAMTQLLGQGWPYGTFAVNIAGSLLMGMLIEATAPVWSLSAEMRALLITGVLGAFTTFSTFSLDAVTLWQRGQQELAGLYVAGSVVLGIGSLLAGMRLMRGILG